jgi:hypothetical protein
MADWVRFRYWDFRLDDVRAVERHGDGTIRVYLPGVREITLTAAEAEAFLPRFNQFTKVEDLAVELPEAGSEVADIGGALEEERFGHHFPDSPGAGG